MMKRLVRPRPGREAHAAGARRGPFLAERDHVLAEDAGAGAGAGHVHAVRIAVADQFRRRRAAEDGRDPQLVAAGEEHAARVLERAQVVVALAVLAIGEVDDRRAAGFQPLEQV